MTSCPIFYFSSKKEIPKTHLLINVRNNQNNEPIIEFKSNINLDLQIDGYDYLLDLHILKHIILLFMHLILLVYQIV